MSKHSRRRFLEDSMFATTAALAAGASVRARADETPQSNSPSEKLSVAILGVRGRGKSHIGGFIGRDDCEITYICDPDEQVGNTRADDCEERQGRRPAFAQDMRQVFDDPSVDIVTIATPNHWHALAAIWAIQAGKDVYVEKPVSHNVSEGRRIVEAARKYKKICQTGTQCRSNPGTYEAIDFVHNGGIGEVKVARGLCYKRRGSIGEKKQYDVPAHIDYDLWTGPASLQPLTRRNLHYDWHWVLEYGNGDLGNQGIHQMDIARWGLGVDDIGYSVASYGGRLGYIDAGDCANTQISIHEFADDKRLVFEVRGLETDDYRGAKVGNIFHGTEGYVVLTSYTNGAAFDLEGNQIKAFTGGADHYGNFLSAVRSRNHEDLNADILEGHLSSALCHLGNASYVLGDQIPLAELRDHLSDDVEASETLDRVAEHIGTNDVELDKTPLRLGPQLRIDPATETFVGSDAPNDLLTREYRAPFVVPKAGQA